jgi:hypothetical protein
MFQNHADRFAKYAAQYLCYPIMDVELLDINFNTAFEAAESEIIAETTPETMFQPDIIRKMYEGHLNIFKFNFIAMSDGMSGGGSLDFGILCKFLLGIGRPYVSEDAAKKLKLYKY